MPDKDNAKTDPATIEQLNAENAALRQEIKVLRNPFNQIESAFRLFNQYLRKIVREDFSYWVEMKGSGEIKIFYDWDDAECGEVGCITDHFLPVVVELLKNVDWDAAIGKEFDARQRDSMLTLEIQQASQGKDSLS